MGFTKSLRFKILAGVIGIFLLASISQGISSYMVGKNLLSKEITSQGLSLANSTASEIETWFVYSMLEIKVLAQLDEIKEMDAEKAEIILNSQMDVLGEEFDNLYVIWPDGKSITNDGQWLDLSDRDYYQEAINGKEVFSSPVISAATSKVVVPIVTPIYSDNEVVGIIGGTVKADKAAELVSKLN